MIGHVCVLLTIGFNYCCIFQFPKGFIAHFYAVSEAVSPTLAWGFLGPDGPLKEMCNFFKVMAYAVCHLLWT
jgi:hypothetical protein